MCVCGGACATARTFCLMHLKPERVYTQMDQPIVVACNPQFQLTELAPHTTCVCDTSPDAQVCCISCPKRSPGGEEGTPKLAKSSAEAQPPGADLASAGSKAAALGVGAWMAQATKRLEEAPKVAAESGVRVEIATDCLDRDERCGEWSRGGKCGANPTFMSRVCCRSCPSLNGH
jgi:hypothetical protein